MLSKYTAASDEEIEKCLEILKNHPQTRKEFRELSAMRIFTSKWCAICVEYHNKGNCQHTMVATMLEGGQVDMGVLHPGRGGGRRKKIRVRTWLHAQVTERCSGALP